MTWNYEVSESCNLQCTYCNADVNNKYSSSISDFKKFKKQYLEDSEPYNIHIFGGEPFLQMELVKYIINDLKDDNKCKEIFIPTNGTIMNQIIKDISKINKVKIIISHDGINQVLNRGNQKVFIEEFKKLGINKTHNMLIGNDFNHNSNFLVQNHLYLQNLGFKTDMTLVRDINTFNKLQVQHFLNDYKKYIIFIANEINNNKYKLFKDLPGLILKYLNPLLEKMFYDINKVNCGLGDTYMVHKPDGTILPCERMSRDSNIYHIFNTGDFLRFTSKCDTCSIRDVCDKGCLYEHIKNNGVIEELCEIYKGIFTELKNLIKLTDYKLLKLFKEQK